MSHGLPVPCCVTSSVSRTGAPDGDAAHGRNIVLFFRLPGEAGAPKKVVWLGAPAGSLAFTRSTLLQSTCAFTAPSVAAVTPDTGVLSNTLLNFSSASPPHRLAVVVCHAPFCWRPMKPLASLPMSSFQPGSSITLSSRRAVLTSPLVISHHQ